jgi:hypothetical protein
MDSFSAFLRGQAAQGNRMKVFDWVTAARLIKDTKPRQAKAGLQDDWEWTGGVIYTADGIPDEDDTYIYLASTWAIPELDMDGEVRDCWVWMDESPGWDENTYWPPEARSILSSVDAEVIEEPKALEFNKGS